MATIINESKTNLLSVIKKVDTFLYEFGNKIL